MPDARRSFVPIPPESDFPLENLPFGVFQRKGETAPRVGVAIGDLVLDLAVLEDSRLLDAGTYGGSPVFRQSSLNPFMSLGSAAWRTVRRRLEELLSEQSPALLDDAALRQRALIPQQQVQMLLPVEIGDYTDFYSSREHATNVGTMLRGKDNALNPNWLHLPVAYHGRASSVVVSGTDIHRPWGQRLPSGATAPQFLPSAAVDFELEMGFLIGTGNRLGEPIPVAQTLDHVFGMVLVNDWSARDIQRWEYAPLGPFLSKNFATSISPWVVMLDALAPFQTEGPPQDPQPLPYLQISGNPTWDIPLEVWLQAEALREPQRVCVSNLRHLYWNIQQQVAHHTCGGCNLRTGDLLATGTISGPAPESRGCLLELTWNGEQPLKLAGRGQRRFLEDGDRVTFTGACQGTGHRVGFGEVTGKLLASRATPGGMDRP